MQDESVKGMATIIVVIVTIAIGLMLYWNMAITSDNAPIIQRFTLTNTTYGTTTNVNTVLSYPPHSNAEVTVTYYLNATATWSTATAQTAVPIYVSHYMLNGTTFHFNGTVPAHHHQNITQVNITYYTHAGVTMRDAVNPASNSIFLMMPITAIIMVAGLVIAIISRFGRGENL